MLTVTPHGLVHALRRFVGLRSAGRRSFAMEPRTPPPHVPGAVPPPCAAKPEQVCTTRPPEACRCRP